MSGAQLGAHFLVVNPRLLEVVNKVATGPVRTETDRVKSTTEFGLVFRMTGEITEFAVTVSELTLVTVLTGTALLERTAEFRLVSRCRLAYAPVELSMLFNERHEGRVATPEGRVTSCVTSRGILRLRWRCILQNRGYA